MNGISRSRYRKAVHVASWPLFHIARLSVHKVKSSVTVNVQTKFPRVLSPQWATVSAHRCPATSILRVVSIMGMDCFNALIVCLLALWMSSTLQSRNTLSRVAGDTLSMRLWDSSSISCRFSRPAATLVAWNGAVCRKVGQISTKLTLWARCRRVAIWADALSSPLACVFVCVNSIE